MAINIFNLNNNFLDIWFESLKPKNKIASLENIFEAAFLMKSNFDSSILHKLINIGNTFSDDSAIILKNIFKSEDPLLAQIVHEAISTHLCGIKDVIYPYEDHKLLFPKSEGKEFPEWSNGSGKISPHSDDLYENINVDLLSLTVSKDTTNCSTLIYKCEDLISNLSHSELNELKNIEVEYISGKNVKNRVITKKRTLVEYDKTGNIKYNFDFRVDKNTGFRMKSNNSKHQVIIDKLRSNLVNINQVSSKGETGTFIVINNNTTMHARNALPKLKLCNSIFDSERVLFRSKGQKSNILNIREAA